MNSPVIRTWQDAREHDRAEPALVEVPGEWEQALIALIEASAEHRHTGLMVTNIGPGSQAAKAGMATGDVLLRYNGVQLDDVDTLRGLTKGRSYDAAAPGKAIIEAVRGSQEVQFEVSGGPLGITISALLHRLKTFRRGRRFARRQRAFGMTWTPQ